MQATAKGELQQGEYHVQADLRSLLFEIGKIADIGQQSLSGSIVADGNWQRTTETEIAAVGKAVLQDVVWNLSDGNVWREPKLVCDYQAGLTNRATEIESVQHASLSIQAGSDLASVTLRSPVSLAADNAVWPVTCRLQGDAAQWTNRVRPFADLPAMSVRGAVDVAADASYSPSVAKLEKCSAEVREFYLQTDSVTISEPLVKLNATGQWDSQQQIATVTDASIASSAIAARATKLNVRTAHSPPAIDGKLSYRSDVGRLYYWFQSKDQPPETYIAGEVSGTADLQMQDQIVTADLRSNLDNLVVYQLHIPEATTPTATLTAARSAQPSWKEAWKEPRVQLNGKAKYVLTDGSVQLDELTAISNAIQLTISGRAADFSESCALDLRGNYTYDLKHVVGLLQGYLGDDLDITGKQTRSFAVAGPVFKPPAKTQHVATGTQPESNLNWAALTASASAGWDSARYHDLPISKADIDAKLEKGVVVVQPIRATVGQGGVDIAPSLHLASTPQLLSLERGKLLNQIPISQQMCQSWLKFVAPVVANATAVKGSLSLELSDRGQFPLDNFAGGEVAGTITLHGATIGPGPFSQEILGIVQQVTALTSGQPLTQALQPNTQQWLNVPEQQIAFRMSRGQVYHEGLYVTVGDVTVQTRGSVGVDQSINMVASVPIRDKWLQSSKYLAGLQGQSLQIPVAGSLTQPRVDKQVMQQFTRQAVGNAAGQLLQGELNRGLEKGLQKLFGPQQ